MFWFIVFFFHVLNPHGSDETCPASAKRIQNYISVLNPHGSDETRLRSDFESHWSELFLTHTVQMKQALLAPVCTTLFTFLTHTVQMKHYWAEENWVAFHKVLNPHGSDETESIRLDTAGVSGVLNPHGSDETESIFLYNKNKETVLNPHGSDETRVNTPTSSSPKPFLTHTVQMKPTAVRFLSDYFLTAFLTHTVQMKHLFKM